MAPAGENVTSRSERCWCAIIRAAATPSRSRPRAMSGRAPPIPACRRSRGRLPGRFGTARAFSRPSPPQETIRACTAAAAHALPPKLNHPLGRAKPRPGNTPHCVGVSSMSPRPYWKGYLKLSLVSCPIAVHAACSSAERISFRQINRKTGNRLRQQLIDEETREVVEAHEKARGYEIGKAQYLLVEDDELQAIEIASTHTIDIDSLVPRAEIDQRFFDAPYYITPDDPVGQDAFAVIREAMRSKALVAAAAAPAKFCCAP